MSRLTKVLNALLTNDEPVSYRVNWRMDADGKVRITTPFRPGRQAVYYPNSKIPTGTTGTMDIELVAHGDPNDGAFEDEGNK